MVQEEVEEEESAWTGALVVVEVTRERVNKRRIFKTKGWTK